MTSFKRILWADRKPDEKTEAIKALLLAHGPDVSNDKLAELLDTSRHAVIGVRRRAGMPGPKRDEQRHKAKSRKRKGGTKKKAKATGGSNSWKRPRQDGIGFGSRTETPSYTPKALALPDKDWPPADWKGWPPDCDDE